jgi:4-amino-4-deoxy-L-arabinose transferase-like glycosyltransferase
MVDRGDWIVPREQGKPFLIRPPLQNWVIATCCLALRSWGTWAVRFPSLIATLLTTLLIYGYSRQFLSRLGAFAAAAAFATMADIFKTGVQAETEALFTLLVSGSLLVWHGSFRRRGPDAWTYISGYTLMALAMLTKGIQAPAYFLGSVGVYLVWTRQWRGLFCRAHLWGALVAAAILFAWMIPYAGIVGWAGVLQVWLGDPAITVNGGVRNWQMHEVAGHLLMFPLEIAAGTLPWSLVLVLYLSRRFRRTIRETRPAVLFLSISLALAFASCWIPPGGLPRYFVPLYPSLAVLIGLVIQRVAEADVATAIQAAWRRYLLGLACLMVVAALAIIIVASFSAHHQQLAPFAEPPLRALAYAGASIALAVLVFRVRRGGDPFRVRLAIVAKASFLVLTFTGVFTDVRGRVSENAAKTMKQLKARLPRGQRLVSIDGPAHSLFAYFYGRPLIVLGPEQEASVDPDYFCFLRPGILCPAGGRPQLPFAWEEIGVISVDRNHHAVPQQVVVVGRRLPDVDIASQLQGGPGRLRVLR